jgi:hypothetical protein
MVDLIASSRGRIALPLGRILALRISLVEPGRPLIGPLVFAHRWLARTRPPAKGLRAQLTVASRWVACGHIRWTSNWLIGCIPAPSHST